MVVEIVSLDIVLEPWAQCQELFLFLVRDVGGVAYGVWDFPVIMKV